MSFKNYFDCGECQKWLFLNNSFLFYGSRVGCVDDLFTTNRLGKINPERSVTAMDDGNGAVVLKGFGSYGEVMFRGDGGHTIGRKQNCEDY